MQLKSSANRNGEIVKKYMPDLQKFYDIYKDIHKHPELGRYEFRTAEIISEFLSSLGKYEVVKDIGPTGVCGVLYNGPGKTVLLRADMDALPVKEETDLPYASKDTKINHDGKEVPVMHACGHDMHITMLLAASKLLHDCHEFWTGTLIVLFQPNEEGAGGAQGMIDAGLYEKIPTPDVVLGQHVIPKKAGHVLLSAGPIMAASNSLKVTIIGRGGHGSKPEDCIDPVVIASLIIVRLQTIVSRSISPFQPAVITVGSIHGGIAENVIPDTVEFSVNIRTYDSLVKDLILGKLRDIINSECKAAGTPRPAIIERISEFPITENDSTVAKALKRSFNNFFGADVLEKQEMISGSEDVSVLATVNETPYVYWFIGSVDEKLYDDYEKKGQLSLLPYNHSSKYAPTIEPTMTTGVQALSIATLDYLNCFELDSTSTV